MRPLDNKYSEPKVEERPLVESRLVCPDGYDVKYLSSGLSYSGTTLTYNTSGDLVPANKTWSTSNKPDPKGAVCVSTDPNKPATAKGSE